MSYGITFLLPFTRLYAATFTHLYAGPLRRPPLPLHTFTQNLPVPLRRPLPQGPSVTHLAAIYVVKIHCLVKETNRLMYVEAQCLQAWWCQ